jgi:DNA-directed RNA polymerase subunit RPC12/RpoP
MPGEPQLLKPFGHYPIVMCPGCVNRMILKEMRPILTTTDLYAAKYRCAECGTETNRQFRHDPAAS